MYRDFAQIGEKFCIVHFPVVKWNKVPTTSIVVEEALLKFCSTHYYMQFILKFFLFMLQLVSVSDKICGESLMVALVL